MTLSIPTVSPSQVTEPLPPLQNGDHLDQPTFHAVYEAMPESFSAELIGGRVYVASPLKTKHGSIHARMMGWLFTYQAHTPRTEILDNATSILGQDSEPQPDGCLYIEGGKARVNDDGYLVGPPELAVEVAHSSVAYDLYEKKADYEKYGVVEYIVLILREQRVVWFVRPPADVTGHFIEMPAAPDGILRSIMFPGLWLDPAALLRGDSMRVIDVLQMGLATPEHAAFATRP